MRRPPTIHVRVPRDLELQLPALAVALTAAEGRIVTVSEARARVLDAGIATLAAQLAPRRAA